MAPKTKKAYAGKGKERPPPIDKLLLPAIGIGLALLLFQFFKGINSEVRALKCWMMMSSFE